jgi:hypothetical protein
MNTPQAKAPSRATTTTVLSLGLASISVELLTGSEESRVSRSQFVVVSSDGEHPLPEYHPVGTKPYDKVTGEDVSRDAIVKGVTVGSDVVLVSDEEMASFGMERGETPILGFVRRADLTAEQLRWLVPTKIYQVRPAALRVGKDKRPNRSAQKLFTLLMGSLERSDAWALVALTLRDGGAKRYGMLDHHGRLSVMAYAQDLREEADLPVIDTTEQEQALMDQMIAGNVLSDLPSFDNESRQMLDDLVTRKLNGEEIVQVAAVTATEQEQDVAELLRKSLGLDS